MDAKWMDQLFEIGKLKGFEQQEIYFLRNKNTEISVYEGAIDKYNISEDGGLSYRGLYQGKLGYAYTELIDESSLQMLVDEAFDNAVAIENEDEVFLHDGSGDYEKIDNYNPLLSQIPIQIGRASCRERV